MSGPELLERLQGDDPKPALVITAHEDKQARKRALAAGAVGFFQKPCDNRQLLAAVYQALGLASNEAMTGKPES